MVRRSHTADLYFARVSAVNGWGIFAGSDIQPGDLLGEYTGMARCRSTAGNGNPYTFTYQHGLVVDAEKYGNYTRWINHSSANFNGCHCYVDVDCVPHILLVATKRIAKGCQVLIDYGSGYWKALGIEPVELD